MYLENLGPRQTAVALPPGIRGVGLFHGSGQAWVDGGAIAFDILTGDMRRSMANV